MSKPQIVYFQDQRDCRYHQLLGDTPARLNGTLVLLKDVPEAEDVEVSCISWRSEDDINRALHEVLTKLHAQYDSPIAWLKITSPSKQNPK